MAGVKIEIRGADETVARMQELAEKLAQPLRPLFETIGEEWVSHIKENFRNQGDSAGHWAALSPTTQKRRRKLGYGPSAPILIRTSDLLQSIQTLDMQDASMSVGTLHESAALLHFGGQTSSHSAVPDRDVPARPFVSLSEEAIADTLEMIEAYFFPAPEVSAVGPRG